SGGGFFDYAFVHDLVMQVVAETVPAERAASRHRRIARVLEELGPGTGGELAATVARQYDLANDPQSAAPRYLDAARHALTVGAIDEAGSLAARGFDLAEDPALRFELLAVQETVAGRKGLDSERTQRLDQLDEIAATLNDDERRRVVLFRRAEFAQEAAD